MGELQENFDDLGEATSRVHLIDVDDPANKALVQFEGVSSFPTIVVVQGNNILGKASGFKAVDTTCVRGHAVNSILRKFRHNGCGQPRLLCASGGPYCSCLCSLHHGSGAWRCFCPCMFADPLCPARFTVRCNTVSHCLGFEPGVRSNGLSHHQSLY